MSVSVVSIQQILTWWSEFYPVTNVVLSKIIPIVPDKVSAIERRSVLSQGTGIHGGVGSASGESTNLSI